MYLTLIQNITLLNIISYMKNRVLFILTLTIVIELQPSCIRFVKPEDPLKDKDFCDSCDIVTGRLFFEWHNVNGDEKYLDSVINIINYALPRCDDSEAKFDMSLRKLSSLCAKNEYDKAYDFYDSVDFDGHEYSCYKQVILNRLHAMECLSIENISERNFYLQEIVDLLQEYLSENKLSVDSVWQNKNETTRDSLFLATMQFYHYSSILRGYKKVVKELDSLYNNHKMNDFCFEQLKYESESSQLKLFLGI